MLRLNRTTALAQLKTDLLFVRSLQKECIAVYVVLILRSVKSKMKNEQAQDIEAAMCAMRGQSKIMARIKATTIYYFFKL